MIPGGSVGAHKVEHAKMGITLGGSFSVTDDGTFVIFAFGGTNYFKIRKSNGDLLISGGVQSDQTI